MCGSSKLFTGVVGTQMKHTHWFPYPQSRLLSLPKYSFFFSFETESHCVDLTRLELTV